MVNVFGPDDDEDEGEVKEPNPPAMRPMKSGMMPLGTLLPNGDPIFSKIEEKIKEMETMGASAQAMGNGATRTLPAPPLVKAMDKPLLPVKEEVKRRPVIRKPEEEKAAYGGKTLIGVSRMAMYRKGIKLGEGTFGYAYSF